MPPIPTVSLRDGASMPQLGFGVFTIPDDEVGAAVTTALEAGYRSIDTASIYGNERGVGAALAASGLPREQLFVTTKVWNDDQGPVATRAALARSLELLGLDHVDLYLIHWPVPGRGQMLATWRTLVELQAEGLTRSIGVSNFEPHHLEAVIDDSGVVPAVNQIELHPRLAQAELRAVHQRLEIVTESWAPLGKAQLLSDPVIGEVAEQHGVSPAQAVLRWHLQHGLVAIPKSVHPSRIRENLDVLGFELTARDMAALDALDAGMRTGPAPDEVT